MASKYKNKQDVITDMRNSISKGTYGNNFLVFDAPPGFGKTHHTIDAIVDICINNPNHKILVVVPFDSQHVNASHIGDEVNKKLGYKAAMYVDASNYLLKNVRLQIPSQQVIIITHSRYLKLCKGEKVNSEFFIGRDTLIIDEKMIFSAMLMLTINELKQITNFAPSSVYNRVKLIVDQLMDLVSTSKDRHSVMNYNEGVIKELEELSKTIKKVYSENHQEDLALLDVIIPDVRSYLLLFKKLTSFFGQNKIIVSSANEVHGHLVTCNAPFAPIFLKNNIMLSASARVLKSFENQRYIRMNVPIFQSYVDWTLFIDNKQSGTQYANSHRNDLIEKYYEFIKNISQPGDEILVVSSEKEELAKVKKMLDGVQGCNFHYTTFHNNVGTNNYSKCTKLIFMSLPKVSTDQAIIEYLVHENPNLDEIYYDYFYQTDLFKNPFNGFAIGSTNNLPLNFTLPFQKPKSFVPAVITFNIVASYSAKAQSKLESFDLNQLGVPTSKRDIDLNDVLEKGIYRPKNDRIRAYKMGMMLDLIYQTVHRINRQNNAHAEIYMVNKDAELIANLIALMPGINVRYDISLNYDKKQRTYDNSLRHLKSKEFQLIAILNELGPGTYEKSLLRSKLGIKDATAFTKLIKKNDFVDYCSRNDVQISARYIKVIK